MRETPAGTDHPAPAFPCFPDLRFFVLAWKLLVVAFALYGVAVVVSGLGTANLSRWLGLLAVVVAFVWVPVALFLALRALMRRARR